MRGPSCLESSWTLVNSTHHFVGLCTPVGEAPELLSGSQRSLHPARLRATALTAAFLLLLLAFHSFHQHFLVVRDVHSRLSNRCTETRGSRGHCQYLKPNVAFHIYPGADTDVTKDKQPGQKSREICWENQGVPSKESLPRCPSISSSIKCPSGSTLWGLSKQGKSTRWPHVLVELPYAIWALVASPLGRIIAWFSQHCCDS